MALANGRAARSACLRRVLCLERGGQGLAQPFLEIDERPRLLVRAGQDVPGGFASTAMPWPAWRLHRVPDPWPVVRGERAARRAAGGGVFHAVQPSLVPAGRTVVTCYDLIPAAFVAQRGDAWATQAT